MFGTNTAASFRRQFKLSLEVSRKSLAVIQECRDCSSAFTRVKCEHIMTAFSSLTEDKQRESSLAFGRRNNRKRGINPSYLLCRKF